MSSVNYSTGTLISSALSVGLVSNEHLYQALKKTDFGIKNNTPKLPNARFCEKWTLSTEKSRLILTGALFLATVHGNCFYIRLSECICVLTDRVLSVR